MQYQYSIPEQGVQASPYIAQQLAQHLEAFLLPLLIWLDEAIDKRLVRTFISTIEVSISFRHRANGLLLSELGAYLLSPDHAPAGTKRVSNLLHGAKWASTLIERFFWHQAHRRLEE